MGKPFLWQGVARPRERHLVEEAAKGRGYWVLTEWLEDPVFAVYVNHYWLAFEDKSYVYFVSLSTQHNMGEAATWPPTSTFSHSTGVGHV